MHMKKSLNKLAFLSLLLFVGMAGCKKQLDINENPNQATETNVTAELILPNALHGVGVQTALGYGWLANWMGIGRHLVRSTPARRSQATTSPIRLQEGKWAGIYNVLFDLHQVEQKALASNQPFYRGIALIMKAHLFQNLVDLYGNVPYSQAFRPSEFPTPAFDKGEDIYADLQVKLDTAIGIMKTAPVTTAAKG
jgi:hypothetical protein